MKYYVCIYIHMLDGEIIYVGKGKKNRAREFSRRSALWQDIVGGNLRSLKVHIVKWFDEEKDAYAFEEILISRLKELGLCRANISIGRKHTQEVRLLLSEMNKGENNPMYGKAFSKTHKKRLSESHTGTRNHLYGRTGGDHTSSKRTMAIFPNGDC